MTETTTAEPSKLPYTVNVSSPYGAPMGRRSDDPSKLAGRKVHLHRVPFVGGDYDQGGAYWGGGADVHALFCAWTTDVQGDVLVYYLRARDREDAKDMIRTRAPGVRFYR